MIRAEYSNSAASKYVTSTFNNESVGLLPVKGDFVVLGNMLNPVEILKRTLVFQQGTEIVIKYRTT